ncbi:hypothetical protein BDV26DRAFT_304254 [Aspergillus bertholletiae]|uniref:Altered inheritance of mitochondria protein 9, mitochondrial n=1 Tax=Aspergillus bertholletiae TaxID=1226010 RepID=A0A5N7B9S4_9EURO|nr:hypothetical protein BDV26DRAFT_304254 [Aspergillus bertholletiae]
MDMGSSQTDWNSNDEFFKFTRGRLIRFDMNSLARVAAADSVGAAQCIVIKTYPGIMLNKVFLMPMDDGQEVIAKVPNANAGIPHFTTASEVATMNFAKLHPVGAEFIIMDKAEGVSLSQVWGMMNLSQKLQVKAIQSLEPLEHIVLFCGPKLYRPDAEKKITALAWFRQVVEALIPKGTVITRPRLWHTDLHDDNIFVDLHNTENITGIIDWQSDAYGLIFLAHRMFEYGEAHFQSLLVDLKETLTDLPAITSDAPFPFDFSEAYLERIKLDSNGAEAGTELIAEVKERMCDLWPDKDFIEHERYDDCKVAIHEVKGPILEQLAETDEEKDKYEWYWPFDRSLLYRGNGMIRGKDNLSNTL